MYLSWLWKTLVQQHSAGSKTQRENKQINKKSQFGVIFLYKCCFCRIWLINFEYRAEAVLGVLESKKDRTLAAPLSLRCSCSSTPLLVPPKIFSATSVL